MARQQNARILAAALAVGFLIAAALHVYGYRQVVLQAQRGFSNLAPLMSAVWLAFAAALVVLGGIVGLVALGRVTGGRWILALAGCFPLATVVLQLHFLGFTSSTAILSAIAAASFLGAIAFSNDAAPLAGGSGRGE
jgi:hypothetical protein